MTALPYDAEFQSHFRLVGLKPPCPTAESACLMEAARQTILSTQPSLLL